MALHYTTLRFYTLFAFPIINQNGVPNNDLIT